MKKLGGIVFGLSRALGVFPVKNAPNTGRQHFSKIGCIVNIFLLAYCSQTVYVIWAISEVSDESRKNENIVLASLTYGKFTIIGLSVASHLWSFSKNKPPAFLNSRSCQNMTVLVVVLTIIQSICLIIGACVGLKSKISGVYYLEFFNEALYTYLFIVQFLLLAQWANAVGACILKISTATRRLKNPEIAIEIHSNGIRMGDEILAFFRYQLLFMSLSSFWTIFASTYYNFWNIYKIYCCTTIEDRAATLAYVPFDLISVIIFALQINALISPCSSFCEKVRANRINNTLVFLRHQFY
ncbi:Hypothetical protein NTJ_15864 [Nesidiocoris tenuis]|uniref:Gustatory receptor n=1 Tax=Nesidiocoris tenuis TaxID=355587 RepID=A0ABN7BF96_9HEMI|nr:Hypothetical protein NTJ_15864 [Nesidiocoris tenuis]